MERERLPAADCAGKLLVVAGLVVSNDAPQPAMEVDVRWLAYRGEDGLAIEYDLDGDGSDVTFQFTAFEACTAWPAVAREIAPGVWFRVDSYEAARSLKKGERTEWTCPAKAMMVMS